ncbi:MAG: ATP-binding protein [Solirubrobacterales bacterium]|nr:ATP-binding protein [Solirubrobacterales bacterium]
MTTVATAHGSARAAPQRRTGVVRGRRGTLTSPPSQANCDARNGSRSADRPEGRPGKAAMMSATAGEAFVHRSDDVRAHLADATWAVADYEYDHVELPSSLFAPRQARTWAEGALPGSRLSAAEHDDVMLLISELVTNAVRHARCDAGETVTVHLAASPDCIRIEVGDRGAGFAPAGIARPSSEALGGRGLFVLDAIASRWGTARADRHCVWLERER